jgi:hypothetical protein
MPAYSTAAAHQTHEGRTEADPAQLIGSDGNPIDGTHPLPIAPIQNKDSITILASGSVTADATSADIVNTCCKGLLLWITPGAFGASESAMVVTVQGKDPITSAVYNVIVSASLTASTPVMLRVYPGLTPSANLIVSDVLPPTWNVKWHATNWGTGGSILGITAAMII